MDGGAFRDGAEGSVAGGCQAEQGAASEAEGLGAAALRATGTDNDLQVLQEVAKLAGSSIGETQPHPNAGCILVGPGGRQMAHTYQRAQGTTSAECQAVLQVGEAACGATAYLNLESGDCHGDSSAIEALVAAGVSRVVVGMRHPLPHLRGQAIQALQRQGLSISVLGEAHCLPGKEAERDTILSCLKANEALLHRAATHRPFSILKYAMTLDGKIASTTGHSAWVSGAPARQIVFANRAASDAVIVGGQTVRRDNPRLTTRRESGHMPARIVMSRTLDLPLDANLWDVTMAPTIVMTQRGARREFQAQLADKGVEVVEFDFLTPGSVSEYCYQRGFLQCLWECGGTLAAPAVAGGVIHKVMGFVAPKIIGGLRAPSPCGDLGFVEMTQAVPVEGIEFDKVGQDMMITGYLPSSGGLLSLEEIVSAPEAHTQGPTLLGPILPLGTQGRSRGKKNVARFYKAWDEWGALSNFSPHAIWMPDGPGPHGGAGDGRDTCGREWQSVEHYYQAQKVAGVDHPDAKATFQQIEEAPSPEEAAKIGRLLMKRRPELIRPDWPEVQVELMHEALRAKFAAHEGPRNMLISTSKGRGSSANGASGDLELVENSPHDFFWGCGVDGTGQSMLGRLLTQVREELLTDMPSHETDRDLAGAAR